MRVLCAGLTLLGACSTAPASRSASPPLEAIAPSGQVAWPVTFSWSGTTADAVVRVRIFDEAERQVFGFEARGTSKDAPPELRSILDAGMPYQWRVVRVDANGEEVDPSAMKAFSLR
jgi:hypothetical protein